MLLSRPASSAECLCTWLCSVLASALLLGSVSFVPSLECVLSFYMCCLFMNRVSVVCVWCIHYTINEVLQSVLVEHRIHIAYTIHMQCHNTQSSLTPSGSFSVSVNERI